MIGIIKIGIGDIVRYDQSVGIVLDITTDNSSSVPGCLIHWLYSSPYDSKQDWVLIDTLELIYDNFR